MLDADGKPTGTKGPFNVELFAGSPDDNNATFFFNGAMDTLKPYLADGTLVVKSGQTDVNQVAILRWDPANGEGTDAGPRCEVLLQWCCDRSGRAVSV